MPSPAARKNKRRRKTRRRPRRKPVRTPVYKGRFGPEQAERLLWRAGFGPRPGEAEKLAKKGMRAAVRSLTRPPKEKLVGPKPVDDKGYPIAPHDAWGHNQLYWMDRMIRTNRPLVERMALIWHDWFATADVGSLRLQVEQYKLLRRHALGRFDQLLVDVTRDPAMLLWLSGTSNNKWAPNENYAREMMELFTLGAGRGYTERDVREMARALTGWTNQWSDRGPHTFRFNREFHDRGRKKVFGRRGRFDWKDACRLCVQHRLHPSFFVRKLWSYFIPVKLSKRDEAKLVRLYKNSRYGIRPVVEAILMHPKFYEGPRMVKPPVVYTVGLLRSVGRAIDSEVWPWVNGLAGQQLFYPPNVSGWDESRWLDTATWRGRWLAANYVIDDRRLEPDEDTPYDRSETPEQAVAAAVSFWGNPTISAGTRQALLTFAQDAGGLADRNWKRATYPILRQNALRMLVATSPDFNTC